MITRRQFIRSSAFGVAALAVGPRLSTAVGPEPVLVTIFLRGAADGLNMVVPAGDPRYFDLRPNIRIDESEIVDLDGYFGLNPALASLLPLFRGGELAIVHAAGNPGATRSHFEDQDFVDRAGVVPTGWLNRHLAEAGEDHAVAGVSLAKSVLPSLAGPVPTLALHSLEEFDVTGAARDERLDALSRRYALESPDDPIARSVRTAIEALEDVTTVSPGGVTYYPATELGALLRIAAGLIRADVGVRAITVDVGGWDHHSDEAPRMQPLALELAVALVAFHADLGVDSDRTLVLAHTEFGRTAAENGAKGSDHGHGSVMLAMGGGIRGGRVLLRDGQWPGLGPDELFEGRDLEVTTDFRDVLAEVLDRHLACPDVGAVLPGFPVDVDRYPGLL